MQRCPWSESFDLYREYHDLEWGVPLRDDQALFGLLLLEGAQAGLSWATILKKRENYRRTFDEFDPARIARYDEVKVAALLADAGIVRNRLKIAAAIQNAKAYLALRTCSQSFVCHSNPSPTLPLSGEGVRSRGIWGTPPLIRGGREGFYGRINQNRSPAP